MLKKTAIEIKQPHKKPCGCNEPCFVRGWWGHFEEVMCANLYESQCSKDGRVVRLYTTEKEYEALKNDPHQ